MNCGMVRFIPAEPVDAPPLPEIREEDVTKLRSAAYGALSHISDDEAHLFWSAQLPMDTARRILAVLEAVSARKGGGNG